MKEKVLITGACGTIGYQLLKYHINNKDHVVGIDINENEIAILEKEFNSNDIAFFPLDVYNDYSLDIIEHIKPTVIIHAAVLKNTRFNELFSKYYHDVNVNSTIKFTNRMLDSKYLKRFIFLSSDEAYNPCNYFGKDKLEVENILKEIKNKGKIIQSVRFPFVLESKGSVYNIFKKQAENNLPLTLTDKKIKKIATNVSTFIEIWNDFYNHVFQNGVFDFDIGEEISIYKLAKDIIKEIHSNSKIEIIGLREGEILNRNIVKIKENKVRNKIFKIN
ncbi:MAG: polysaccharide biosynthesis protein [Tissierellia bacterium]|nr:polysaccharide biosynthesis protein [Tissierellia bacterium]